MTNEHSFIELHPWRRVMNVGVEVVKPRFKVDDGPDSYLDSWKPTRLPVLVGCHRVEMWMHWTLYQNMGRNSIDVDVPLGGVRVSWRSPGSAFSKGKMEVESPGDPALAIGIASVGVPGSSAVPPGAVGAAPPGWVADPWGRHELRYWDGSNWTPHVSDNGVTSQDGG